MGKAIFYHFATTKAEKEIGLTKEYREAMIAEAVIREIQIELI